MASICPRCRKPIAEDTICCAELRHTWKCDRCGKRTTGFVVPYGMCFLCGGPIRIVEPYQADDARAAGVIQEAMQFELDTYHFYLMGRDRTTDSLQRAVFAEMAAKEREHVDEIEQKYHVHLDPALLEPSETARRHFENWVFKDLGPASGPQSARDLYAMAIKMERRTQEHFARRAQDLPPGPEKEVCRELAAEEVEHVAILETELANLAPAAGRS